MLARPGGECLNPQGERPAFSFVSVRQTGSLAVQILRRDYPIRTALPPAFSIASWALLENLCA